MNYLKYKIVERLRIDLNLPLSNIANILNISERTLARRKKEGQFHEKESRRLSQFLELIKIAEDVMGDRETAIIWLKSSKRLFKGVSPIEYAYTESGLNEVVDFLGRIDHGVFS
ncbi:MAG TPA: DUF2384 domain-containing protein [Methylophaga aminisulfidivorans]|uniref:DUF2384 domain-containing protein n=2 Tax=root TaxID=1 RepID=A0A7C1ZS37_9GAMM|nr:DUF2384 domain-containing protein [Methylophaga sp.]HEC74325.1 DUF2384 domain-containing protein [Methylophaga aminisulfidivorans]